MRTKLHLIYVCLLAAFSFAATSCSDDENKPWQNIPDTPVSGADAEITFNGQRSYGQATVMAKNDRRATLTLSNIVPGYPEIVMPVDLDYKSDGTFAIDGEADLPNAPVMMPRSASHPFEIYEIEAKGYVTTSGRISLAVTSELTDEAQAGITGRYAPCSALPLTSEGMTEAPVVVDWTPVDPSRQTAAVGPMLSLLLGNMLYQSVREISFLESGNIIFTYTTEFDIFRLLADGIDTDRGVYTPVLGSWTTSGTNLTFWYVRNNMIFLTPYIPNILDAILVSQGKDPNAGDGATDALTQQLIEKYKAMGVDTDALTMLFTQINGVGFPMIVEKSGRDLRLTLTKQMIDPVVKALIPALPYMQQRLQQMIAASPDDPVLQRIVTEIMPKLGITSLTELGDIWNRDTRDCTVTLHLRACR